MAQLATGSMRCRMKFFEPRFNMLRGRVRLQCEELLVLARQEGPRSQSGHLGSLSIAVRCASRGKDHPDSVACIEAGSMSS